MLRVGERILLLALSDDPDKHPLGYLSSRLLTDVEGRSSLVTLDCTLSPFRDGSPGEKSFEPTVVSDCVFRVEACMDRHDASRTNATQHRLDIGSANHSGIQPGTPVRYSKAIQLMHELSGALLCIDVRERAANEGFAMKVVLKTVEPSSDSIVATDDWLDTWWELRSPGNVRISPVLLHFDEICLHSNRWHRSVRAQPAAADRKNIGDGGVDWGTESTPMLGIGAVVPQDDSPGEVDASFAASLLRVVPFDDYPSPPPSDDFLAHDVSSTTLPHAASTGEPGRSSASPGGTKDGDVVLAGSALRGGDVVRICHLTSAGFLTHEAVPTTPPRPSRAADDNVVIDEDITARIEKLLQGDEGEGGHFGVFLYVSTTPQRRQKLQNASSNCLWVLERTHCALGGRPLRRNVERKAPQGGVSAVGTAGASATAERGQWHNDSCSGTLAAAAAAASTPSFTGIGLDVNAHSVAKLRSRQGAGDAVEYVRIKHLATKRYLCVGNKCDLVLRLEGDEEDGGHGGGSSAPGSQVEEKGQKTGGSTSTSSSKRTGDSKDKRPGLPRVGMVTVERRAAVPAATVFAIRPRSTIGASPPVVAASTDGVLGPTDLVHLQHRETGLFLATMPRDDELEDGRVDLTVVKSPLTSEYWRITRATERERKATNRILTALAQLKAASKPLLKEVDRLPFYSTEHSFSLSPPPVPSARVLRPAAFAVAHFHSVVSRGSGWWLNREQRGGDRATSGLKRASASEGPSIAGQGLKDVGQRAGRGSAVWALARSTSASRTEELTLSRKKDKSGGGYVSAKSLSSWPGVSAGTIGSSHGAMTFLDEFHANPKLRFQLLLREQGVIVTLFDAMNKIFRARDKLLMRTLWWDDDESANVSSIQTSMRDASFFEGGGTGNWENVVENAEARRILRRLVREAMALADFFAKDNARGKVVLEPFTILLREMIGSGLGACELLATIRRDNPRTSLNVTATRIQEIVASLPESRDLANSMRLLASICRVGHALLPTVQRLVAVTVLVGDEATSSSGDAGSAFGSVGGRTTSTAAISVSSSTMTHGGGVGDKDGDRSDEAKKGDGGPGREGEAQTGVGAGVGGRNVAFNNPRGLFHYELISNTEPRSRRRGSGGSGGEDAFSPFTYGRIQAPWWSPDGTRGIRVRLERLIKSPPPSGTRLHRLEELFAQNRISSGEVVVFETWLEKNGSSKTVVRVVSRGGVDELPMGRRGAGASSSAGDLLEYFVESVKLLSTLCRERHAENIALLSALKGTSYKELMEVVRCETVPLCVRGAFALLVERMHLDVAPLLPKPPVRYVRLKDDEELDSSGTGVAGDDILLHGNDGASGRTSRSEKDGGNVERQLTPPASRQATSRNKGHEQQEQRERLRDALKFTEQFLYKNTRPGGTLHLDHWQCGEGTVEQPWEPLPNEGGGRKGKGPVTSAAASDSLGRAAADATTSKWPQSSWRSSPAVDVTKLFSEGLSTTSSAVTSTSAFSKPLQLNESLQLLGAVLSTLRLTLTLLGRRPFGRGSATADPSPALFRRLCSLLDFLEDVRELRKDYTSNAGKSGRGGAVAGTDSTAMAGGPGGAYGRSYQTSRGVSGAASVGIGVGGEAEYASTSKLLRSLANEDAVGITDTELSVMKVLALLLGHEVDGQIDRVLRLADVYDNDGSAFCLRLDSENRAIVTVHGNDIWTDVHSSGVGLLAGKAGETTAHNLGKTLLRLAVVGQQKGREGGPSLTARSFSLLFRINSQGSTLVREARKVTLLTGHAAAETHDRLTHAVAALHAFSRRRRGRPNTHPRQKKTPPHYKNDPAPSPPRRPRPGKSNDPDPTSAHASGESQHTNRHFGVPSQSPMMSTSSPLSHSMSTDDGSLEDAVNNYAGDHGCVGSAAMEAAVAAAAAAEIAAQAAAKASAAAAAAAAAARSAALSAEGAAHTETSSIAEALEEIRTTLAAGRKDAAGVGAEVERVAAGVGLAPALLGALRALGTEGSGALGDERAAGRAAQLVAEVMNLLRLLVEAGANTELRRLLFSNFSLLISFLKVDMSPAQDVSPGARRLLFAEPVARLMGAVIDGNLTLVTSVSDEHLTQLARKAARSRETELLKLLQKMVTCNGAPVTLMQRRVLVTLLRELSLTDFHAAFGWQDGRPPPVRRDSQRSELQSFSRITVAFRSESDAAVAPSGASPDDDSALTTPEVDASDDDISRRPRRMVSWGAGSESLRVGDGGGGGDMGQRKSRGESIRDSATSGVGFMCALQRALLGPKPGGIPRRADAGEIERHALELLQVIAACCEGKNHFTEVQCRSMVSLEGLIALITRGGDPLINRGGPAPPTTDTAPRGNDAVPPTDSSAVDFKEEDEEKGDRLDSSPARGRLANVSGSGRPRGDEVRQVSSDPAQSEALGVSSWFREHPALKSGDEEAIQPLSSRVRWALLWLLDSLFFSVKEPIEDLDRHPAVHALLEHLLAVAHSCTYVPASERWENEEIDFLVCDAAKCLLNFFADCWRDPLPLVAKTARKLVSKLAILFHSLANDVRIIAENAGLEWKWRQDNGIVVNEGTWVGHCDMETSKRLERRKRKLTPLRNLIFELYQSGDRRKRELFSLFHFNDHRARVHGDGGAGARATVGPRAGGRARADSADAVQTRADSTDIVRGRGRSSSVDLEVAMGSDDQFRDVFRVMQELDMIAGDSPTAFREERLEERSVDSSAPPKEDRSFEEAKAVTVESKTREPLDGSRRTRERAPLDVLGESGRNVRSRNVVRAGSVRYPRRKSSGGSSGFYRDLGHLADDNWQSITASAPDLAPRLPIEWTNAHSQLSESPQHQTSAASFGGGGIPQLMRAGNAVRMRSINTIGSIAGAGDRSFANISTRSIGITGTTNPTEGGVGSGALGFQSRGVSARFGLYRSTSGREGFGTGEALEGVVVEGPVAAATASALLYGTGFPGGYNNASSRSLASHRREGSREKQSGHSKTSSTSSRTESLRARGRLPSGEMSARLASFVTGDDDDDVPRLQLNEHEALLLLEASIDGNGELEDLVADLRKPSRDENVRALIGYVCSAPLDSETDDSALISGNRAVDKDYPTRKSAADAGPETSLKRFGLKILRAIIETAPAVGDGSESLSGVWQAGDSKRNGDGANEECTGRQQQQERIARLGGGNTILLFVGGLSSSSTSDTASDAFELAIEMLRDGNKRVQEYFFSVLRDSREDERFFAAVTGYIRASVKRIADTRRRLILERQRGAAKLRVKKMAAAGSRRPAGATNRRRRAGSIDQGLSRIHGKGGAPGLQRRRPAVGEAGRPNAGDTWPIRGRLSKSASTGILMGPTNRDGTTAAPKRSILHRESGGGGADGSLGVEIEDESHPAISPASSAGGEAKEASSLGALMEFLRLLCENHYTEMQDYMRTQPDNMRSYNVVSEIAGVLQGLEWVVLAESRNWGIDSTTIDLAYGILRTLVEFAQGNEGNKLTIATPSVASSINDLFIETFDGRGQGYSVKAAQERGECKISPARLKNQGFVLLHSLIEGCHEPGVYCTLIQTLDFEAIHRVVMEARETYCIASRDYNLKKRKYLNLRRAKWRASIFYLSNQWKGSLEAATEEFKSSEDKWQSARRAYSTPIVFLRALLDGAKAEHTKLCAKETSRFKIHLEHWKKHVLSIEIKREDRLEKMYFVVPEWCWAHWEKAPVAEMRTKMKKRCAQAKLSPSWKLAKFDQHGEDMLTHIKYLHNLQATSLHVITGNEATWSFLTFFLSLTINVVDIFGSAGGIDRRWMQVVGIVVGGLHVVISCLRQVAFMYNRQQKWLSEKKLPDLTLLRRVLRLGPVRRSEGDGYSSGRPGHNLTGLSKLTSVGDSSRAPEESHYVGPVSPNRSSKRMTPSSFKVVTPSSLKILGKTDSLNSLGGFNLREGTSAGGSFSDGSDSEEWYRADRITGRQGLKREGGRGKEVSRVDKLTRTVVMLSSSKWNLLYVLVSLLGLSLSLAGYIKERSTCYAFCLLDVSIRYRAMHRVLRAVSKNWAMLWQTAMLVVVVLFVFAAMGTSLFSDDFALGLAVEAVREGAEDFRGCDTLGECTITFFQYALRGDLGTYLYLVTDGDSTGHRMKRFIFDVSYWVLVPLLLLNMVSGVILDSFAQLRDEEAALQAELKSRCVVCGISRNEFDRGGNVFFDHITHDHCMWNYVLVRAYLKDKPELEHTGQESYVYELQNGGPYGVPDVSYFPIGEAGVLEGRMHGETSQGGVWSGEYDEGSRWDGPSPDGPLGER